MENTFKCIIIDDDEADRLAVLSFARKYAFLNITGVYSSVKEALSVKDIAGTDVLLCDICMPLKTGFELRSTLMHIPVCIFITAFSEFAIEGYEYAAFDFLLKPLNHNRFDLAMQRLKTYLALRNDALLKSVAGTNAANDTIFVKDGREHIRLNITEVVYLEALKDYTLLFTPSKKYYLLSSISNLLVQPKFSSFIRVHRSYAVHRPSIQKITRSHIMAGNVIIPIGRIYKDNLKALKE